MIRDIHLVFCILAFVGCVYLFEISTVRAVDVQTSVRITICGNGLVESDAEVCDSGPGQNLGGYSSTTAGRTCSPGCESFGPYCGDNILQVRFSEQCDDGNEATGDLCTPACISETPAPPGGSGSPTVGSTPAVPGGTPGAIRSETLTRVVLRGKAYPNADVSILLDGKITGSARADSNANFVFSTEAITPGTATFGFSARDRNGIDSITTSIVFEVVQSAVTTVANVFFPPTIAVANRQIKPGDPLDLSGQTVPRAKVITMIGPGAPTRLEAVADAQGMWALQVDTKSIASGAHNVKAYFEESEAIRSGFGRSVTFAIGEGVIEGGLLCDLNGDGKVNLVDFSIFLISWNTDDTRSDFNADGIVNLADFSIMLFHWTG